MWVLILLSGVYASYYGGNISYAIFYLCILTPAVSMLYTVYVYIRFKLYQSMDNYLVVKGDWLPYSFVIANEDYITFHNIRVNFIRDKSTIEASNNMIEFSLLPNESEKFETRIRCNYRGEYYVGVESIVITDYLDLFNITYPIQTKLKVYVMPRVIPLEKLGIAPNEIDVKNPLQFSNKDEEELDFEVRNYNPGDSMKQIHWKATARLQELISRKYQYRPRAKSILLMDLMKIDENDLLITITEDKIIESILAYANFYKNRSIPYRIMYDSSGKKEIDIERAEDFDAFYKTCVSIRFEAKQPISELLRELYAEEDKGLFVVVATHTITKEFYMGAIEILEKGNYLLILFISDDITDSTNNLIQELKLAGAEIHQIFSEDEIEKVLS